jgi:hypothetical protein
MASPAAEQDEFAVLDQLIVRSLVTLRMARAAYRTAATPRNLELRDRAEDNLNALLDFRAGARQRRPPGEPAPGRDARRLPA